MATTFGSASSLFLEEREVGTWVDLPRSRRTRLLGTQRISHARRSLDRGALFKLVVAAQTAWPTAMCHVLNIKPRWSCLRRIGELPL
jgi:hypothetical protein